ncbi:cytochrome family protein [Bradyrhizobium sp. SZCCHNRI20481]|uniref:cytochrome family protein n=1 Tax=Bradyrhizobium sp. SZCCHNRI20481 TaxID=3057286 RepID=UPI0029161F64|nr:cytochrome family protein [Bradyrhizobium sp. SZCCHNRI20481]
MHRPKLRHGLRLIVTAAGLAGLASLIAIAAPRAETPTPAPAPAYLPTVSDLMIATIQPRHLRLWIAGHSGNWTFSAYELGNLKGAFNRVSRAQPLVEGNSFADMTTAVTQQPFDELAQAIKQKDIGRFERSYADLTAACNSCHQALNRAAVVIKVPQTAGVADQDFTPGTE